MAKKQKVRPAKPERHRYSPKPQKKATTKAPRPAKQEKWSRQQMMAEIKRLQAQLKKEQKVQQAMKEDYSRPYGGSKPQQPRERNVVVAGPGKPQKKQPVSKGKKPKPTSFTTKRKSFKGKKELLKERKRSYGKRDRLREKRKNAKTKKERLRLNKEILAESTRIGQLNDRLGSRKKALPKLGKRTIIAPKQRMETLTRPVWDAKDELNSYLRSSFWKKYIIQGVSIPSRYSSMVLDAFQRLEDKAYEFGRSTPHVVIIKDFKAKEVSFDLY